MEVRNFSILSWNVNSLQKRATDVHSYVLQNSIDIIALQEIDVHTDSLQLSGYQRFELQANLDDNTRGLVTCVKNSILRL